MKLFTKIIREVLKQFYTIFYVKSTFIRITVNNISDIIKKDKEIELFKMVYFITFVIILFCIVIGLFSFNYRIRGIAIPITGGFIIHEVLILILILVLQYDWKKIYKKQDTIRFVDNPIYFIEIDKFKNKEYFYGFTFLSAFLNKLDNNSKDSILKFSSLCVEFLIYTLIYSFSNRLISIDKTLIFLVLIIMSIKTCLKFFLGYQNTRILLCFKITRYDFFCLITFTVIFILSSYVKLIRDILVNIILSVFYSIILSLLISIIYYEKDDFFYRLKTLLSDKEDFPISKEKIGIEYIFMNCFILYLITIFLTWRLFWKKKTIVKMSY